MVITIAEIKKNAETKMHKSVEALKHELQKIRTGRAHPGLLDQVHVDYYGSMVPISQVANVSLLDARTISVQPWEKGMGAKIEKAIRESDLGLEPSAQGGAIRVPLPQMNEQRRKELVKIVHKLAEDGKIAVRHARTHARDALKKLSGVSEDDVKHAEKDLQKVHDDYIGKIDQMIKAKEAEIMEV